MQVKRPYWSIEALSQVTHTHHKLFCEVMHDQNVLQLCGLHILYIVCMTLFALSSILIVWNMQSVAYDGAETVEYSVQPTTNV